MSDLYVDGDNEKMEKDTKVHLCDTCIHEYPICIGVGIKFGDGFGNDNIYKCDEHQKNEVKNG